MIVACFLVNLSWPTSSRKRSRSNADTDVGTNNKRRIKETTTRNFMVDYRLVACYVALRVKVLVAGRSWIRDLW